MSVSTKPWPRLATAAILIAAAWLRLAGLDWDGGHHLHPDERFLTMVETAIVPAHSLAEYFDTARSPLNPANHGYKFFVYGTLPLFLVRWIAHWLGMTDYAHLHFVGRALSALFDVGTVWLTARLGSRLGGRRAGLFAAALVAFSVTSIQNAHFFTVDSPAAFFATAALSALVRVAETASLGAGLVFGAMFGAALGCRINLALLGAVYPLALFAAWKTRRAGLVRLAGRAIATGLAMGFVFRVVQPYAFAGPGFFSFAIAPEFLASIREIHAFVTGAADYPPAVQWIGRTPILFAAKNLLVWGIGPAWALAAIGGIVWWVLELVRAIAPVAAEPIAGASQPQDSSEYRKSIPRNLAAAMLGARLIGSVRIARTNSLHASLRGAAPLAWGLLLFGYQAAQFTATGRYFLPVIPVLAIFAAWPFGAERSRVKTALAFTILAGTALWAISFSAIYRRPLSRVEASRWIVHHVPSGSTIANEHWDDGLPLPLPEAASVSYRTIELHLYDDDTPAKRRALIAQLAAADYISISSNRLYRSIPREPWRYPLTRRYYELLFAGDLGFRLERSFTSYPRLGPLEIPDDDAEEAFTVYDHPHVLIFKKTEAFSRERVEELLGAVSLSGVVRVPPRQASALYRKARPADVPLPASAAVRTAVAAEEETSLGALVRWGLVFEVLSLAAFAIVFPAMRQTADGGFGLAKLLAWLGPGYVVWLLSSVGLAANTPETARGVAAGFLAVGALVGWRCRRELAAAWRERRREIIAVEAAFLLVATIFLAARAVNPAIFWGEKPMDFAFLNAILRSRTMPPADPWFAGGTLNYFYFGHTLVGIFAETAGVGPAFAFNLAIATIGGLLSVSAFLVGRRLGGGLAAGAFAAFAVTLLGNLDGPRLRFSSGARPIAFDYFWATSRVVADTINEFPVWNLLFADLHAHVLAQPLEVALVYVGLLWLRGPSMEAPSRLVVAALSAWLVGAVATTSAWSVPAAVGLALGFLVTSWRRLRADRGGLAVGEILASLGWWVFVALFSCALFWPFWQAYRRPVGRSWGWETAKAPLADVLTIFGTFLVVLAPVLIGGWLENRGRRGFWLSAFAVALGVGLASVLRSPAAGLFAAVALFGAVVWCLDESLELQITGLLTAGAGVLGLATETVFLWDHMNTVFKYYLEMWLLLGCISGGVLPWAWRRSAQWRFPWRPAIALATAALALSIGGEVLGYIGPDVAIALLLAYGAAAVLTLAAWRGGLWRLAWAAAIVVASAGGVFTAASGAVGLVRSPFARSDVPTLDGMNYLRRSRPSELAAYRWLNREVGGIPVLVEAHGDSYGEFSRVSMNTGLPTVLGWEYHLFQQAHPWPVIYQRRDDVRALYSTTDLELAERLIEKYHVDLVFVGGLERRTYPPAGLAKFATWPRMKPVFQSGDVTIYATPGLLGSVKTWIEEVSQAEVAAAPPLGVFREPRGIARAADGTIFVADFGNRRIQRLSGDLHAVGGFGREGDEAGRFRDPCGVAVGPGGDVYVADTWNHRIQKLSPNGEPLAQWTAGFYGPRGIAIDRQGRIFVSDTGNRRIVRLGRDGAVELEWGRELLDEPVGIALGAEGEVYVADAGHRRIVVFTPDGELRRAWPIDGWKPTAFAEPYVDVGPDGVVWVTDPSGDRVLLYDAVGRPLGRAEAATPLAVPLGIAVLDPTHALVASARTHSLSIVSRTANTSVVPER